MNRSWKTTVMGAMSVLGAIFAVVKAFIDGDPSTVPDWTTTWAAIIAGVGLMFAKDADKTGLPK